MKTNYPDTVQKWLDGLYTQLQDDGFFKDHKLGYFSQDNIKLNFYEILGDGALQSWLSEGEVKLEGKELSILLFQVIIKSHLQELKQEGTIDSIENEDGDEIMWLTSKGKDENKEL